MTDEIKKNVLDKGHVTIVNYPENGDLQVVNAARVSFGKKKLQLSEGDEKLIKFLAKYKHDSPFRHTHFTFRIKAPEFVMRQWYKHVVGIAYTPEREVDHAWNEISGRYVVYEPDFYYPEYFRKQSSDNKQATIDEKIEKDEEAMEIYKESVKQSYENYKKLIDMGVGKEQARAILPLNFYTEVIWTASLQAILNFISLRDHQGSQKEIQVYAQAIKELLKDIVPVSMNAWEERF